MLDIIHGSAVEFITFLLIVVESFLPRYDAEEVWLNRSAVIIATLVFFLESSIFCCVVYYELLLGLVSVVFNSSRYLLLDFSLMAFP